MNDPLNQITFMDLGDNRLSVRSLTYGPLFAAREIIENGQSSHFEIEADGFDVPGLISPPGELYSRAAIKLYAALLCQQLLDTGH